jgi:hypothetical protein
VGSILMEKKGIKLRKKNIYKEDLPQKKKIYPSPSLKVDSLT